MTVVLVPFLTLYSFSLNVSCKKVSLPQRSGTEVHEKLFSKSVDPGVLRTAKTAEGISIGFGFLQTQTG